MATFASPAALLCWVSRAASEARDEMLERSFRTISPPELLRRAGPITGELRWRQSKSAAPTSSPRGSLWERGRSAGGFGGPPAPADPLVPTSPPHPPPPNPTAHPPLPRSPSPPLRTLRPNPT